MNPSKLKNWLIAYLGASYRRKKIDALSEKYRGLYHGIVLDIGGRDRGKFKKPKNEVEKWIFADIVPDFQPDMILDVTDMKNVGNNSIDVISALELFEHVNYPEKGVTECYRTLKYDGTFIASTPFLYGIHADPFDFQRWTGEKWKLVLKDAGFKEIRVIAMGTGVSVILDMFKSILRYSHPIIKYSSFFLYPIFDCIETLDRTHFIQQSILGRRYVGGYYIIAKK